MALIFMKLTKLLLHDNEDIEVDYIFTNVFKISKFRLMNKSAGTVSIISHNQMLLTSLLANITLGTMYGRHLPSTAVTDSSVSLSFEICTACITCDCGV